MSGVAFLPGNLPKLRLVTCVSNLEVLQRCLLTSPCVAEKRVALQAHFNVRSAAEAFNTAMASTPPGEWVVWVHQDVRLPDEWDHRFAEAIAGAQMAFECLAIAGVYGLRGFGDAAVRAGRVLDRGQLLDEPAGLPALADSLDELLIAVQSGHGLTFDPTLGFDFYATDVIMAAREKGLNAAVVDGFCEHWSDTPSQGTIPRRMAERICSSGAAFEAKWLHRFPVQTSWLLLERQGDVERFIKQFEWTAA